MNNNNNNNKGLILKSLAVIFINIRKIYIIIIHTVRAIYSYDREYFTRINSGLLCVF